MVQYPILTKDLPQLKLWRWFSKDIYWILPHSNKLSSCATSPPRIYFSRWFSDSKVSLTSIYWTTYPPRQRHGRSKHGPIVITRVNKYKAGKNVSTELVKVFAHNHQRAAWGRLYHEFSISYSLELMFIIFVVYTFTRLSVKEDDHSKFISSWPWTKHILMPHTAPEHNQQVYTGHSLVDHLVTSCETFDW